MRVLPVLILFALLLQPAHAAEAPPPPPVVAYDVAGAVVVAFEGGRLSLATGVRPLFPWPVLCEVSPCRPAVVPGDALAVVALDGSASAVVVVPPRGYRLALPWVGR